MWHKPCRTFHPWCLCIKTRCLSGVEIQIYEMTSRPSETYMRKQKLPLRKNGGSPVRRQAIIWINVSLLLFIEPLGTSRNNKQSNRFKKSAKWGPLCMASQINDVSIFWSTVCSGADKKQTKNIKASRHWPLWGESAANRWIPLTKGQ